MSGCSLTVGMCLEWTRRDDDVITENEWSTSEYMSKTLIYGGAIISAGPAALIASMQTKLREVLTIGTLFTLCGSIVLMTCSTGALSTLIIGRILHGMGAGVVCVVVPNYAAEITEPKYRGENFNSTTNIDNMCGLAWLVGCNQSRNATRIK